MATLFTEVSSAVRQLHIAKPMFPTQLIVYSAAIIGFRQTALAVKAIFSTIKLPGLFYRWLLQLQSKQLL
jgi:hypothetical protein